MIFPFNNYRKTRKVIKKKLKYIYFFSEFSELFFFLVFFYSGFAKDQTYSLFRLTQYRWDKHFFQSELSRGNGSGTIF